MFALGRALAAELARAHAETPPALSRHRPRPHRDGRRRPAPPRRRRPRPRGARPTASSPSARSCTSSPPARSPDVSWRLDGPPPAEASTLRRRAVLAALASPGRDGFATAAEAESALDAASATRGGRAASLAPLPRRAHPRRARAALRPASPAGLGVLWQAPLGAVMASPLLTGRPRDRGHRRRPARAPRPGPRHAVHEVKLASALESSPALARPRAARSEPTTASWWRSTWSTAASPTA